jgi:PAS domain S-box-containing protein
VTANAAADETLRAENVELRARLEEAEEMLRAIHAGEVDALVVESTTGPRIFTLQGVDADVNRFRGEILAQVNDAVIAVDNLQRVTYLNSAAEHMYGVSASEVLGCHLSGIHESIWPHAGDEVRAAAALHETGRWYGESVHCRRDGSTIHVESSVSMLHDMADGTSSGQLSVIRDITERKRAEEALRESERRFRLALKNSPVSVAIQDRNLVYQWAYNQKSRRPDEIIGKTDADLFAPEEVVWIHEVKQRVLETGKDVHMQHWVTSNGQRLFLDLTFEPLRNPAGEVSSIGIAVVDLTQQKLVEEALKASAERHRLLAETMLQGVVHQDADGTIIAMNPTAERILGKTREQFVGSSSLREDLQTIREDGSPFPGFEHPAMVALRTGQTVRGVVMGVFNPQLGAYRWISIDAVPLLRPGESRPAEVYTVFEDITERKQAEGVLRQSEERLRLALQAARMATWDWDILTGQVIWNDEHYRMLGYEPHGVQPSYEAWVQRMHPDDRAKTEALLQCAMEHGTDYSAEFRVVRPDGTEHWLEARGQFERDAPGRTVRCYGVMIDFTQRKRAEEALAAAYWQTQDLIDNTTAIVYAFDLQERFVMANVSIAKLLNSTPAQMIGKRRHDFMPQVDADWHEANDRKVIEAGRALDFEERSEHSGRSITWLTTKFPLRDSEGKIYAVGGFSTDISERKRAEDSLRESEAQLRLAQESANVGIWDWKVETGDLNFTPELNKLYGLPAGTIKTYQDWRVLVHPDDIGGIETERDEAITKHEPFDLEFRGRHSSGEYRWISTKGGAIYSETGKAVRVFGVNIDITEHKRAEDHIKTSLAEKEVLLQEIHHRVKNNLQVISSLISLQAASLSDDRVREALGDIGDRIRTIALVHEKFYQIDNLAQLDFADYAASLLNHLWHTHGTLAGRVRFTLAMEPVMMPIESTVTCGLILNELAGNALKHAFPNGRGGEVIVGLDRDPATDTLCLWVRDNGIGLPEELEWRQANTLGLRLVRILAVQLRGTVATAPPGPGTEFRVTFIQQGIYS